MIDRGNLGRAVPIVIADPVDIDAVIGGGGIDFEVNALSVVDRELRGERDLKN